MDDLFRSEPHLLSRLLETEQLKGLWNRGDLAGILRHQLAAPLLFDPKHLPEATGPLPSTFGELFVQTTPSVELLNLAKEFGKSVDRQPESPVPAEVGTVLYFAAIAVALVQLDCRITELDEQALREGFSWGANQNFVPAFLVDIFEKALTKFQTT